MEIIVYNHFDKRACRKTSAAVFTFTFESPYILFRMEATKMYCNFATLLILTMRRCRNSKKKKRLWVKPVNEQLAFSIILVFEVSLICFF